MAGNPRRRILPFSIPFFRIWYSTSFTILYIITLCFLAITPVSLIWAAIQNHAYQYVFIIGGVYVLTGVLTIFIYSSRLYTNRTVLAAVGKAYIPIEQDEVSRKVRRMIVKQLERSAIVSWEARPRDVIGEILEAEKEGMLSAETMSVGHNDYTVGTIIPLDPARPPWGRIQHPGWSSPSHGDDNKYPNVQFAEVIEELPNLIEARAVSLAPSDPSSRPDDGEALADPAVAELLTRPPTMGMREYLTQLSYLGVVDMQDIGQEFLQRYEQARFSGRPVREEDFAELMSSFSKLLSSMNLLDTAIVEEIRLQSQAKVDELLDALSDASSELATTARYLTPSPAPPRSPTSQPSPVTAREDVSRTATPYLQEEDLSVESLGSVLHHTTSNAESEAADAHWTRQDDDSILSLESDSGSVLRHPPYRDVG